MFFFLSDTSPFKAEHLLFEINLTFFICDFNYFFEGCKSSVIIYFYKHPVTRGVLLTDGVHGIYMPVLKWQKLSRYHLFVIVLSFIFVTHLCIYCQKIRICHARHEYKHDSKKKKNRHTRLFYNTAMQTDSSSCLLFSCCKPVKEVLMGVQCPAFGEWAKFTSHCRSPGLGKP